MRKYHINNETDRINICRAKTIDSCPLSSSSPHFNDKEDAQKFRETILAKNFNSQKALTKKLKKTKITSLNQEEATKLSQNMYEEFKNMSDKISTKAIKSLHYYSVVGHEEVNAYLRGGEESLKSFNSTQKQFIKDHSQRIKEIMNEFGHNQPQKTVYRYIKVDKDKNIDDYIKENFTEGKEYVDRGYMSTTEDIGFLSAYLYNRRKTRNFIVLEIETDKGLSLQTRPYEQVGRIQSFEKERLLPSNISFEIKNIEQVKAHIDQSRESLFKQFNGSAFYSSPIPPQNFTIIKLIDKDLMNNEN